MSQRERSYEDNKPPAVPGSEGCVPDPEELAELRGDGDAFLKAGDEAISRALSANSEAFLEASRQRGGQ